MTRRQFILDLLDKGDGTGNKPSLTASQIAKIFLLHHVSGKFSNLRYISGSFSSILRQMVKKGEIEIDSTKKGPRGGMVYKLKF